MARRPARRATPTINPTLPAPSPSPHQAPPPPPPPLRRTVFPIGARAPRAAQRAAGVHACPRGDGALAPPRVRRAVRRRSTLSPNVTTASGFGGRARGAPHRPLLSRPRPPTLFIFCHPREATRRLAPRRATLTQIVGGSCTRLELRPRCWRWSPLPPLPRRFAFHPSSPPVPPDIFAFF